eukprot:1144867-Pelagomonas_calceolata.AAC.1
MTLARADLLGNTNRSRSWNPRLLGWEYRCSISCFKREGLVLRVAAACNFSSQQCKGAAKS